MSEFLSSVNISQIKDRLLELSKRKDDLFLISGILFNAQEDIKNLIFTIEKYIKYNEEHQSLAGMQDLMIEKLQKEILELKNITKNN